MGLIYESGQKQARAKRLNNSVIKQLVWSYANFRQGYSLSHLSREMLRWMHKAGIPVIQHSWEGTYDLDIPVATKEDLKTSAVVVMDRTGVPQASWDELKENAAFVAAYYVCDGTKVREPDLARLEGYDAVFTPSEFCHRALIESKLHTPSFVWGLGFDHEVFTYIEPKPDRPFTFLWFGDESRRKGYDLFLRAFSELKVPNTRAWVRSPGTGSLKTLTEVYRGMPNVVFDHGFTPASKLRDLMAEVDVVVSPHRCEGFGLCPLEAMACGRPAIMTRWSGVEDYGGSDALTYWIEVEGHEPAHYDGGVQARPNYQHLLTTMRKVALSLGDAHRRGILVSEHVHEKWRWADKALEGVELIRSRVPRCRL